MESWLARQPGTELVAAATTAPDTIAAVRRERPDVLVMDLYQTGESTEVVKALVGEGLIGHSGTRVIPFTAVDCRDDWGMSILEGSFGDHARNHVWKAAEPDVLAKAIAATTG
jgi:DNA-binding NarL/FixJ family response regulator